MKKKFAFIITSLLSISLLAGCGKGNKEDKKDDEPPASEDFSGPGEDEKAEELVLPTGVTGYTLDETDYSTQPEKPTEMIRIHYRQKTVYSDYSNYEGWKIWAWDSGGGGAGWWRHFTKYDAYGVICELPVSEIAANGQSIDKIGMVFTDCPSETATWEGTYSKEPNEDVLAELKANNPGGVQEIYVRGNAPVAFFNQDSVFLSSLSYAYFSSETSIVMTLND